MVVNAPQSNIISAAEHTMALLLAQARNVPQAHAALVDGRWERSEWEGVELADKTLGIVGLGRIGKLVADRAKAFQMRLIAYDPFVSADRAKQMGVELLPLDQVVAESDFLTIHLPKTKETAGLINRDLLVKAKPSLRVINVARGGIVRRGRPRRVHPRRRHRRCGARRVRRRADHRVAAVRVCRSVVVTPHLGASHPRGSGQGRRRDRRHGAAGALSGEFVPWAVNVDAAEANETIRPFLPLAETLGRLYGSLHRQLPDSFELCCQGEIADYDTRILGLAVLKGFFSRISEDPVSYVNAPGLAKAAGHHDARGQLHRHRRVRQPDHAACDDHSICGTLAGRRGEQRIVEIDGHGVDVPPAEHMLVITNDDRPGVIGTVGVMLGDAGVNIADMDVGRVESAGTAVMVIVPTGEIDGSIIDELRASPGILSVDVFD